MTRSLTFVTALSAAGVLCGAQLARAHSGPPFPVVLNRIVGDYSISVWTDPDTTDDGTAAGQFWVVLAAPDGSAVIPNGTEVTVAVRPLSRKGPERTGRASPVNGVTTRQFVALVMDHEGPFGVRVTVEGPMGRAEVESQVDATYDQRPAPGLMVLYLFPFLAIGALWAKVLLRRRRRLQTDERSR